MMSKGLAAFVKIVELGSFTRAAEELYTSQSALSQQIRTLEAQLGFELFDHSVHRVALTEAGKMFYPRARQVISLYNSAVQEVKFISETSAAGKQRMRVGTLGDQIFRYWMDLFRLSDEAGERYAPVAMRFRDRAELYRALQQDKADVCLLFENGEAEMAGLEFEPLTSCRELCVVLYASQYQPQGPLALEELNGYRLAFHFSVGHNSYEDRLRAEIYKRQLAVQILEPKNFFDAEFGIPSLLLVPELCYPKEKRAYTCALEWGEGPRLGFIYSPECGPRVREYVACVQKAFAQKGSPW